MYTFIHMVCIHIHISHWFSGEPAYRGQIQEVQYNKNLSGRKDSRWEGSNQINNTGNFPEIKEI